MATKKQDPDNPQAEAPSEGDAPETQAEWSSPIGADGEPIGGMLPEGEAHEDSQSYYERANASQFQYPGWESPVAGVDFAPSDEEKK